MSETIAIEVNGQSRELAAGSTVAVLVESLGLTGRRVAVEQNRVLVKRDQWTTTSLHAGDQLEILHFVGGG